MFAKELYLPTRPSRLICLFLILIVIIMYFLDSLTFFLNVNRLILNSVIKPLLCGGLICFIVSLPKTRSQARLKHKELVNFWALCFAVIYLAVWLLAGIFDGFGRSPFDHSPIGIITNIIFVISNLITRELIRSYLIKNLKLKENILVGVLVVMFMTLTNIPFKQIMEVKWGIGAVEFFAKTVAPLLCHNILATYLNFLGGPLPSVMYMGIPEVFYWLSPILPNLKWITMALIGILCPIFSFMSMKSIYEKADKLSKVREGKGEEPVSWMVTSLISIMIIWFSVGVFPIYPSVIATGSMEPMIKPGDVILIQKIKAKEIKVGDVIQFKRDNIFITHRIIEILNTEEGKSYRTKGDNNSAEDKELVKPEFIKGKIISVVPKIGWPTLLMKKKDDIRVEDLVF